MGKIDAGPQPGPRPLAAAAASDPLLSLFLLTLPFSYALQVIFFAKWPGALPYLFLLAHLALRARTGRAALAPPVAIFALFIIYAVGAEFFSAGAAPAARLALIYLLPLSLCALYSSEDRSAAETAAALLALAACAVAVEELYEFASFQPTLYEARNFLYVKAASGLEMGKWQGATRPGGILDHIHASAAFIGVGLSGSALRYLKTGRTPWLAASAVCAAALLGSGMRLQVAAAFSALLLVLAVSARLGGPGQGARAGRCLLACAAAMLLLFAGFRHRTQFWDFYANPLKTGTLTPGTSFSRGIVMPQVRQVAAENHKSAATALLGQGFMTTRAVASSVMTDDFVLAQLYGTLGLLGLASYLSLFAWGALLLFRSLGEVRAGRGHEALFAAAVLLMLFVSLFHSGVAIRKQLFPLTFLALGILASKQRTE